MKNAGLKLLLTLSLIIVMVGCQHNSGDSEIGDTIQVPEGLSEEDSIAYIENQLIQSPISMEDLLNLAEVHTIDSYINDWLEYNNEESEDNGGSTPAATTLSYRDSCALRLANRFMRMHHVVELNGNAMDNLQWAQAVNTLLDTLHNKVPEVDRDSAVYEISSLIAKYSSLSQADMNFQCYIDASIEYYRVIEAYRKWIEAAPKDLKMLVQNEYQAWFRLNKARFVFWRDVSFSQAWYSMKPMEIEGYHQRLSENRMAELKIEQDIILNGSTYKQKGKTVTTKQWNQWIENNSKPDDYDFLMEVGDTDALPSGSTVAACVSDLRQAFSEWLVARQALAAALPKDRGTAYDNLTADIHARIIGKLPEIITIPSISDF